MNNQEIMNEIESLQSQLSRGHIEIDAPCGADPLIDLLGGLHARAAINETRSGRFPNVSNELDLVTSLIASLRK